MTDDATGCARLPIQSPSAKRAAAATLDVPPARPDELLHEIVSAHRLTA